MKFKAINCLFLIMTLFSSSAFAIGFNGSINPTKPTGGTRIGGTISSNSSEDEMETEEGKKGCVDAQNHASLNLAKSLMLDPEAFEMSVVSNTPITNPDPKEISRKMEVLVKVPPYVNSCIKLDLVPIRIAPGQVHLRFRMMSRYSNEKAKTPEGKKEEENFVSKKMNYDEYLSCLKEGGHLDSNGNIKVKTIEISKQKYVRFSLNMNPSHDLKINFDSFTNGTEENSVNPDGGEYNQYVSSCYTTEDAMPGGVIAYKSSRRTMREKALEACLNGDVKNILAEMDSLKSVGNASDLFGNAKFLEKMLSYQLAEKRKGREKEIFDELKQLKNRLAEIKEAGFKHDQQDSVEEYAERYVELVEEINKITIQPSLESIERLLLKRTTADSASEVSRINNDIKDLSKNVGELFKKTETDFKVVMEALREYSLGNEAINITGFMMKSQLYAKETAKPIGRNGIKLNRANRNVVNRLKGLKQSIDADWMDVYLAKRGDKSSMKRTSRDYNRARKNLSKNEKAFRKREAKLFKKYCQPSFVFGNQQYHEKRCRKYQKQKARRTKKYLSRREKDLKYIQGRKEKWEDMNGFYQVARERISSNAEANGQDRYGFYDYGVSYNYGYDESDDDDFDLGFPVMQNYAARAPAAQGGNNGFPVMGPMGGPNPYSQTPSQRPGFMGQPSYFNNSYRGY